MVNDAVSRTTGDGPDSTTGSGEKPRRGGRVVRWVAFSLFALVVSSGVVLYVNRDLILHRKPIDGTNAGQQTPPPPEPPELMDPSQPRAPVRSLISIVKAPGGQGRPVFIVGEPGYHTEAPGDAEESVLVHEIVRQAVLLAARDHNAITRDPVIGDAIPESSAPTDLELSAHFVKNKIPVARLTRLADGKREVVATYHLGAPFKRLINYAELVEQAEMHARSPEGFWKILIQSGLAGEPIASAPVGQPAAELSQHLSAMMFTEQFAALRGLHEEIRQRGESPERLGALARGYSNLGVLTEFQWGGRNKALKARALLAAQRMVAKNPRSRYAIWHRAYVRALVGFHKDALDDLGSAERLAPASKLDATAPSWVALVDAFCRFQTEKLLAAKKGPDGQLAMLLAFLSFEYSRAGVPRVVSLGEELLRENPECYRVTDTLCRRGGVGSWHRATLAGLIHMSQQLPEHLKLLAGLPTAAAETLDQDRSETKLVAALTETAVRGEDTGEPTWSALGRMIADTRFALVYLRCDFMKMSWGVPANDFLEEVWPLVADHPYRGALEAFRINEQREARLFSKVLSTVNVKDICFNEDRFIYQVGMADMPRHMQLTMLKIVHSDLTYGDFARLIPAVAPERMADAARDLQQISPYAPQWRAELVERDWPYAERFAKQWESDAGGQPDVFYALGSRYLQLKRWDDAERCLKRVAQISPDVTSSQLLAEVYKRKGDTAAYEQALKAALKEGDVGLGHMQVRMELAYDHMRRKQWAKALPYAQQAASTGAAAGMLCLSDCYEGLGQWEEAERWQKSTTERYAGYSCAGWFYFCVRTGHGNLAAARKRAYECAATLGDSPSNANLQEFALLRLVDGAPREAIAVLQKVYEINRSIYVGYMMAALHDMLGEAAERDKILDEVARDPLTKTLEMDLLVKAVRDGIAAGDKAGFDPKALVPAFKKIDDDSRWTIMIFTAPLAYAHGDPAKAKSLLERCRDQMNKHGWGPALATVWLRELGAKP